MTYFKRLWDFLRSVPAWVYAVLGWGVAYLTSVSLRKERARAATTQKKAELEDKKDASVDLSRAQAEEEKEKLFDEHEDTMSTIEQSQEDLNRAKSLEQIADLMNALEDK